MKKTMLLYFIPYLCITLTVSPVSFAETYTSKEIKQKLLNKEAYIPYSEEEEKKVRNIIKGLGKKDEENVAKEYLNAAKFYLEKSKLNSTRKSTIKGYRKTASIAASIAVSFLIPNSKEFKEAKRILIECEKS